MERGHAGRVRIRGWGGEATGSRDSLSKALGRRRLKKEDRKFRPEGGLS